MKGDFHRTSSDAKADGPNDSEIVRRLEQLARLHGKLSSILAGKTPLREMLKAYCRQLAASLDAALTRVWLMDEPEGVLRLAASAGNFTHLDDSSRCIPVGEFTIGEIASTGKAVLSNDIVIDPSVSHLELASREGIAAFAGYPLIVENRVVGVVALFASAPFGSEVSEHLQLMADALAQCIARREAEQALVEREKQLAERESDLRRVIDNMLGMVGVLDTDGSMLDVNEAALNVGGLLRHDVIGKKFWECYWWDFDPAAVARLQEAVRQAAEGIIVRYDTWVRTAGDTRMMVDFMLAPVRDEMGTVTHLIPSGIDITERKRAENAAQLRERHLNLALEAGRMGSWAYGKLGMGHRQRSHHLVRPDLYVVWLSQRSIYKHCPGLPRHCGAGGS